ncbi:hypothetical protein [Devosia sp. CN2-171]|jgi:hypothetical protein|uniref:hypothetical protein n=1 Tax=Devosia sp. CN2-171 TaxID=3400909 RepID=UPI003BF913E9
MAAIAILLLDMFFKLRLLTEMAAILRASRAMVDKGFHTPNKRAMPRFGQTANNRATLCCRDATFPFTSA